MSKNYKLADSTEDDESCDGCVFDINNLCEFPLGNDNAECWSGGKGIYVDDSDPVNSPSHYTSGSIECIDAIQASMSDEAFKGFLKGNCSKYLFRSDKKGKELEDLQKCRWYLDKLIGLV